MFQDVCSEKFLWDELLPQKYSSSFYDVINALMQVKRIVFPRVYCVQNIHDPIVSVQVHGFSDASERAYGCCIYLRFLLKSNNVKVNLVSAKSRVSPLCKTSIPRLELLGNVLLSRLLKSVVNNLASVYSIEQIFAWTDSSVSFAWIQNVNKIYKSFIQTRVKEI